MIHPTEDDASPSTAFVQHVPSGSTPLPNDQWVRGWKIKDYALCLDPKNQAGFFGWLMLEGFSGSFMPVRRMTVSDLVWLHGSTDSALTEQHRQHISSLLEAAWAAMEQERTHHG